MREEIESCARLIPWPAITDKLNEDDRQRLVSGMHFSASNAPPFNLPAVAEECVSELTNGCRQLSLRSRQAKG